MVICYSSYENLTHSYSYLSNRIALQIVKKNLVAFRGLIQIPAQIFKFKCEMTHSANFIILLAFLLVSVIFRRNDETHIQPHIILPSLHLSLVAQVTIQMCEPWQMSVIQMFGVGKVHWVWL